MSPENFVNKLIPVLEHSKEELTEFLQTKPVSVLKQTRDLVFAELVTKLPIYAGRQLYARRKVDFLLEDIYVFAFSAVNGLPDQRLSKCLKLLLEIPDDEQEENDTVLPGDPDMNTIVEMCLKLKEKVKQLENTIKDQNIRITFLENEHTITHAQNLDEHTSEIAIDNAVELPSPDSSPDLTAKLTSSRPGRNDNNPTGMSKTKKSSKPQTGSTSKDQAGDTRQLQPPPQQLSVLSVISTSVLSVISTEQQSPNKSHRTQSFPQEQKVHKNNSASLHEVYVGKLDLKTKEQDIKYHLAERAIDDVTSVRNLSVNNRSHCSFCISVASIESYNTVLKSDFWPDGITVRPFRSNSTRRLRAAQSGSHKATMKSRSRSWSSKGSKMVFSRPNYGTHGETQPWTPHGMTPVVMQEQNTEMVTMIGTAGMILRGNGIITMLIDLCISLYTYIILTYINTITDFSQNCFSECD